MYITSFLIIFILLLGGLCVAVDINLNLCKI